MHIDADYQVHYIIIQTGSLIHSTLSLQTAVYFLNSVEFDLILSEPHQKAIIKKENNHHDKIISKFFVSSKNNQVPIHPE